MKKKRSVLPRKNFYRHLFLALAVAFVGSAFARGVTPDAVSDEPAETVRKILAKISHLPPDPSYLPLVKDDGAGRTWVVWEERENAASKIVLGQYEDGELRCLKKYGDDSGFHRAPDLIFDAGSSPWIAWVGSSGSISDVRVMEVRSERTWIVGRESAEIPSGPKLVVDRKGFIWAFWNRVGESRGDIVCRVFDGHDWSAPRTIPRRNPFPALNPAAVLDSGGRVRVVWSSYDGTDYELFATVFDGTNWHPEVRLTENPGQDVFPSLALDASGSPLLSWARVSAEGTEVCAARIEERGVLTEAGVFPAGRLSLVPRIVGSPGSLRILWKSVRGIDWRAPAFVPPARRVESPAAAAANPPLYNPSLQENVYVGFGDSITYGYIDRLPAPELGYVPRLDVLLNQHFGGHSAINQGVPGENTIMGLARIDSVLRSENARYFLIMEGTNDVITDGLAVDTSAFNLSEIVRKCLSYGVLPVFATIIPRQDWVWFYPFYRNRHLALNEKIRQIAASFAVPFIDMYVIFDTYPAADGGLLSLLSNDLKHPSVKGYQFMAEVWFNEIRNLPFAPVRAEVMTLSNDPVPLPVGPKNPDGKRPENLPLPPRARGNLIIWKTNPKVFDPAKIKGYVVYRKKLNSQEESFVRLVLVEDSLHYFDPMAEEAETFVYLIAAVRSDGVEGPCASPESR